MQTPLLRYFISSEVKYDYFVSKQVKNAYFVSFKVKFDYFVSFVVKKIKLYLIQSWDFYKKKNH